MEVEVEEISSGPLPGGHQAFVDEYVVDHNGTQAYLRVYPDCTWESAKASASRLLTNVNVLNAIGVALEQKKVRCQINADDVVKFWKDKMFADKNHVELETVQVKREDGKDTKNGYHTFRAPDRMKASENLAKHLGMFKEILEGEVQITRIETVIIDPKDDESTNESINETI